MRKVTGIAVGLLLAVGAAPALAWEPTKPVEEKQALKPTFLKGQEMLKFLEEDDASNKSLMTEAGFVAQ
jgi:hypothetical protein